MTFPTLLFWLASSRPITTQKLTEFQFPVLFQLPSPKKTSHNICERGSEYIWNYPMLKLLNHSVPIEIRHTNEFVERWKGRRKHEREPNRRCFETRRRGSCSKKICVQHRTRLYNRRSSSVWWESISRSLRIFGRVKIFFRTFLSYRCRCALLCHFTR